MFDLSCCTRVVICMCKTQLCQVQGMFDQGPYATDFLLPTHANDKQAKADA